jgi:hypothetical protein
MDWSELDCVHFAGSCRRSLASVRLPTNDHVEKEAIVCTCRHTSMYSWGSQDCVEVLPLPTRLDMMLFHCPFQDENKPELSAKIHFVPCTNAVRAVGCAVLQPWKSWFRFPMVSLEFFNNIILSAALCLWGRLSLWPKWVPGMFPGGKGGWCVGLTTLLPSCADCLEIWEP